MSIMILRFVTRDNFRPSAISSTIPLALFHTITMGAAVIELSYHGDQDLTHHQAEANLGGILSYLPLARTSTAGSTPNPIQPTTHDETKPPHTHPSYPPHRPPKKRQNNPKPSISQRKKPKTNPFPQHQNPLQDQTHTESHHQRPSHQAHQQRPVIGRSSQPTPLEALHTSSSHPRPQPYP